MARSTQPTALFLMPQHEPVGVVRDAVSWHGPMACATKRTRIRAGGLAAAGGSPA